MWLATQYGMRRASFSIVDTQLVTDVDGSVSGMFQYRLTEYGDEGEPRYLDVVCTLKAVEASRISQLKIGDKFRRQYRFHPFLGILKSQDPHYEFYQKELGISPRDHVIGHMEHKHYTKVFIGRVTAN